MLNITYSNAIDSTNLLSYGENVEQCLTRVFSGTISSVDHWLSGYCTSTLHGGTKLRKQTGLVFNTVLKFKT